ncbi:phytanoyl-CoA dioxygenase family protein [Kribbella sp. NPDC050820]|uniref:phytanoyl-CoA dioxygenase family protein n=1 Tax=unclassified Kribbella TaxID=2644121 RepID=UPI0033FB90B9
MCLTGVVGRGRNLYGVCGAAGVVHGNGSRAAAGEAAYDIATAIVMLDDNTVANGAMTLIPGSPAEGPVRRDPQDPTGLLVDPLVVDASRAVTVEAPAGSVLMFPGLMVHRSAPNRTASDRRSLLYCFQPAGRPELSALTYDPERLADLP